jgi:hypothetical protein
MADPPHPQESTPAGADRASPPGMPRWVKVSGIVVAVLIILVVLMMLLAGGGHGPGRHIRSVQSPPTRVTADLRLSGDGIRGYKASEVSRR